MECNFVNYFQWNVITHLWRIHAAAIKRADKKLNVMTANLDVTALKKCTEMGDDVSLLGNVLAPPMISG